MQTLESMWANKRHTVTPICSGCGTAHSNAEQRCKKFQEDLAPTLAEGLLSPRALGCIALSIAVWIITPFFVP